MWSMCSNTDVEAQRHNFFHRGLVKVGLRDNLGESRTLELGLRVNRVQQTDGEELEAKS